VEKENMDPHLDPQKKCGQSTGLSWHHASTEIQFSLEE